METELVEAIASFQEKRREAIAKASTAIWPKRLVGRLALDALSIIGYWCLKAAVITYHMEKRARE